MKVWPKPTLIVSKCLGDTPCRYNGTSCTCKFLSRLKSFVNIIEICPEEGIGLSTPRNSIRLVGKENNVRLIDPKTLMDYTKSMTEFSNELCDKYYNIYFEGFLLKSRSPSCGIKDVKVYSSTEKGSSSFKSKGLFASIVKNNFFYLPIEDEGRLTNFNIREHFLTSIFTLASFNEIKTVPSMDKIIKFHSINKLLLMSYSKIGLKKLDKIIANQNNLNLNELYTLYEKELYNQLKTSPKYTSKINTFNYAFGYFANYLSNEEKKFYLETLEKFSIGKLSTNVLINLIKSYAIRFNNDYLLAQTLLDPYPESLLDLNDSGNGICID